MIPKLQEKKEKKNKINFEILTAEKDVKNEKVHIHLNGENRFINDCGRIVLKMLNNKIVSKWFSKKKDKQALMHIANEQNEHYCVVKP